MNAIFNKNKFKYFILRRKVKPVSFHRQIKYLNLFFQKVRGGKGLKSGMQKTELKNLHFSTRYL